MKILLYLKSSFASDYFNVNLYTDFEKTFAKSHHLKALAGFQAEANNYRNIWAQKIGITYPGKPTINTSTGIDKMEKLLLPTYPEDTIAGALPDSSAE